MAEGAQDCRRLSPQSLTSPVRVLRCPEASGDRAGLGLRVLRPRLDFLPCFYFPLFRFSWLTVPIHTHFPKSL